MDVAGVGDHVWWDLRGCWLGWWFLQGICGSGGVDSSIVVVVGTVMTGMEVVVTMVTAAVVGGDWEGCQLLLFIYRQRACR